MIRRLIIAAAILSTSLTLIATTHAGLVTSIVNLAGPTTGTGTFEVLLLSTESSGGVDFEVTGFSFALSVASDSGVQFTFASSATVSAPYLFEGTGIGSIDPNFMLSPGPFPSTSFGASDVEVLLTSITVRPGDVFGLGYVGYSVARNAPGGTVAISFDDAGTSLSDASGNAIDFTADQSNGVIDTSAVPEPSSLVIALMAVLVLCLVNLRSV